MVTIRSITKTTMATQNHGIEPMPAGPGEVDGRFAPCSGLFASGAIGMRRLFFTTF